MKEIKMDSGKKKVIVYLLIVLFGVLGIYLTFIAGDTSKYDSKTKAYNIYPNESYDSEDGTMYHPIYYFKVDGKDYECEAKTSSNSYPSENKNIVYYDSSDPTKCKTEYDKSATKFAGIIFLIVTSVVFYFIVIKKVPIDSEIDDNGQSGNTEYLISEENQEKIHGIIEKFQLIYKRVILGIIIVVLLVFVLIDSMLFKQTIKAKNYIEATATYVDKKETNDDEIFEDYIYAFVDEDGKEQEIIESYSKNDSTGPKSEIKIKYNKNNPQDYYEEGSTLDKKGMIWYIVKVVVLALLIILFCNKKLLSKINISINK